MKKFIDKGQKVYVRRFSEAKVRCMKDVNPCIRENTPFHVLLHVRKNDLNSDLLPERTAK